MTADVRGLAQMKTFVISLPPSALICGHLCHPVGERESLDAPNVATDLTLAPAPTSLNGLERRPRTHSERTHVSDPRNHVLQAGQGTIDGREVRRDVEAEREGWHAEDARHDGLLRRAVLDDRLGD